ncbi:MAG: hypothetical protein JST39_06890 [Bacteroidetes bacterium]|nr:hypothetical protein [Bacteroidota bacterium]
MRIAHLVITYTNPQQTARMIRSMQHPDFDFYIHVDKKLDIAPHLFLAEIPHVYLIRDRVDVIWGGYNTIEAELRSVQEIFDTGREYDYIHLMSGQDYPIKPARQIYDFFEQNRGKEFLEFEHFDHWDADAYTRIQKYHFTNYKFPGRYSIQWLMNRLLPQRVSPVALEYFGSSMFWALTPACLRYIIAFLRTNNRFRRFIRLTWGSDEFLFQTLVLNSHFQKSVVNSNLLYLDRPLGAAHPNIISDRHLPILKATPALFTRKVDMAMEPGILDSIDELLLTAGQERAVKKTAVA